MSERFFEDPILNSPYERPSRHWELVEEWRHAPESEWKVKPETARLLKHWRHHEFHGIRPFFCQIEAAETAIWLTAVAPGLGKRGSNWRARV
jgi:type III restriction enzyme